MFEITYIIDNVVDDSQIDMLHYLKKNDFNIFEIQPEKLISVENIKKKTKNWAYEYFNNHQKHNPSITNAGVNMLAIHKNSHIPFNLIKNINNYYL